MKIKSRWSAYVVFCCSMISFFLCASSSLAQSITATKYSFHRWQNVSPLPNSENHHPETNIIFRSSNRIDERDLRSFIVTVKGNISGEHKGRLRLSDDRCTILFLPTIQFELGERVTVAVTPKEGSPLSSLQFSFGIRTENIEFDPATYFQQEMQSNASQHAAAPSLQPLFGSDSLPHDFPFLTSIVPADRSTNGYLYLSNVTFGGTTAASYLMMVDNDGTPVFQKRMGTYCYDFTRQSNGLLTYYQTVVNHFTAINDQFEIVDSFKCGNGYTTDLHELRLLPNGHALLMSYDPIRMDFSHLVDSGRKDAIVLGLIVQEIDKNKDVVFQWRSWDHFEFPGLIDRNALRDSVIDYAHGNAIDTTIDGNIVISSRHLSEITKIDRTTGDILWRLGGAHNQFTFVNDTLGFSFQHCIRQLPNGNFTMFDNGNTHPTPRSRAVEYQLDEKNRTATLIWQYQDTAMIFGWAMGSVQRLPNGNTVIGWGATNPTVTEVTPMGEKVVELSLPVNNYSYRVIRSDWLLRKVEYNASNSEDVLVYPNPVTAGSTVHLRMKDDQPHMMILWDMTGKLISRTEGRGQLEIATSALKPGVYLLQDHQEAKNSIHRLVVLQ